VQPDDERLVVARVDHAGAIVAAVEDGVLAGVQFHPERSGAAGARVLENVLQWSRSA
jgi:imidazole glycerol-phosphate synthase subunit HisH